MTIEILLIVVICYIAVIAMMIYSIVTAKEMEELEIEPIEITPEKKDINSIVAASKSVFLKPPTPKPKINPAQVPAEDVPNLFKESMPQKEEPKMEYEEDDEVKGDDDIPERTEVISAEVFAEDQETRSKVEPTRPMCMDYMQMAQTITRMVRGTVSISDKKFIEQLEGTELFDQMEQKMTTTNLERVRSILNNI